MDYRIKTFYTQIIRGGSRYSYLKDIRAAKTGREGRSLMNNCVSVRLSIKQ